VNGELCCDRVLHWFCEDDGCSWSASATGFTVMLAEMKIDSGDGVAGSRAWCSAVRGPSMAQLRRRSVRRWCCHTCMLQVRGEKMVVAVTVPFACFRCRDDGDETVVVGGLTARLAVADLWWLPAWWQLGFEEKLGFLFWKMVTWQALIGQFGEWRIMTRVTMWLDRFRR